MGMYHGRKVFDGLVTANNSYGETRMQFFTGTDGQDQYDAPLDACLDTLVQYGQEGPSVAFVDNVPRERKYLLGKFVSLRKAQHRLDLIAKARREGATTAEAAAAVEESGDTYQAIDENISDLESDEQFISDHVCFWESMDDINRAALVIRGVMEQREVRSSYLSLDAEWLVVKNARGHVTKVGKIDLLQISFRIKEDSPIKTHLFKVSKMLRLPVDLLGLLQEPSFTFLGSRTAGDVTKIQSDFSNCAGLADLVKTMDIGSMARRRGIQPRGGSFGLEGLSDAVLGEKMDKSLQCSDWTKKTLGAAQKKYAALDAIKSLEIFLKLLALPDLTAPLPRSEMKPGRAIHISAPKGSISIRSSRIAAATIVEGTTWSAPPGFKPLKLANTSGRVLVEISKIAAPSAIIPDVRNSNGKTATLSDFGPPPFRIMIPATMTRCVTDRLHSDDPAQQGIRPLVADQVAASIGTELDEAKARGKSDTPPSCSLGKQAENDAIFDNILVEDDDDDNEENEDTDEEDVGGDVSRDASKKQFASLMAEIEADARSLSGGQILDIQRCLDRVVTTHGREWHTPSGVHLSPPPEKIDDCWSAVLGDGFHISKRIVAPLKDENVKAFQVAFVLAWYAWNPELLQEVADILLNEGISQEEIDARQFFDIRWFSRRVNRAILPPSLLYWRA